MADQQLNAPRDVAAVSVGTAATKLISNTVEGYGARRGVFIQPDVTLYIGGANVTTATGLRLDPFEKFYVESMRGQGWYGIVASGTANVRVLPVY